MGMATDRTMAALRNRLGLDISVIEQFGRYVWGLLHLDLGYSARFNAPVVELIGGRLGNTVLLMLTALGLALLVGVTMGVVMAMRAGRATDHVLSFVALLFYSVPVFWGALILVLIFSVQQMVAMAGTRRSALREMFETVLDRLKYHPTGRLTVLVLHAAYARLVRTSMLEAGRRTM